MGSAVVSIPTRSRDVPPTSLLHSPLAHQTVSGIGHTSCSARRRTGRPGRSRSPFPTASFRLRRAAVRSLLSKTARVSIDGVLFNRSTLVSYDRTLVCSHCVRLRFQRLAVGTQRGKRAI